MIGETGSGKSTLVGEALLPWWRYLVVIRTKMDPVRRQVKYPIQTASKKARVLEDQRVERVELRPEFKPQMQRKEIRELYDRALAQRNWTIYNDEEWYLESELKLEHEISILLTQGGGRGITLIMSMQRPSRVSRFCLSQAHHVITFGVEGRDIKVVAEATTPRLGMVAAQLDRYEFAWFDRGSREIWVGRYDMDGSERLVGEVVSRPPMRKITV